jgi:hypothetical protein
MRGKARSPSYDFIELLCSDSSADDHSMIEAGVLWIIRKHSFLMTAKQPPAQSRFHRDDAME